MFKLDSKFCLNKGSWEEHLEKHNELSLELKWQTGLVFAQGTSFSKHPQTIVSIKISSSTDVVPSWLPLFENAEERLV